ncbi:hypothetical protein [Nocardioides marmorisolisilvae]|uniref:Uncharacterized protein n=1 Tax=Nocardioides marmorisolisilvae TaxID=1542737 RepID=A0A3N0DTU4_9ACTN|nr:hypothetical protein [Nocardioides marmorisolisilvae]RNL79044.1 hypothetical protein EFL95_08355 [Nocardioides marmorisolisilvae]
MTYERLAYDDQDTAVQMHSDCSACASEMGIPEQRFSPKALGLPAATDVIRVFTKPVFTVTETAAQLANRIRLHLD